jgi:hypothetical protein
VSSLDAIEKTLTDAAEVHRFMKWRLSCECETDRGFMCRTCQDVRRLDQDIEEALKMVRDERGRSRGDCQGEVVR